MKASSGSTPAGDEYSRFLLDRIKQLEEVNYGLKGQLPQIEEGGRDYEAMQMQYEREVRKLRSELEKLRASPLIIGTVVEVIDDKRVVVKSSTGPKFVVNYSQFIDTKDVVPGAQVGMNQQSLAVVSVLPSAKDPAVYGMEVIESPDVGYGIIGGLDKQIDEIREGEILAYVDVDLATDLKHLEELINAIKEEGYDFSTGSRMLKESDVNRSFTRLIASETFNALTRFLLKSDIKDHQCGFKAFRRGPLFDILDDVKDNHWFWDTELLVRAQRRGYAIKEFPVRWRSGRNTKVDLKRDVIEMGTQIIRLRRELKEGY